MITIAPAVNGSQAAVEGAQPRPEASSYGGVLLLAKAWAALGGGERLMDGVRWQGKGGPVLLFVLVALPVVSARSVLAVAAMCAKVSDPLMAALDWPALASQRRLARFVASPRHRWMQVLGAMARALAQHPATGVGMEGVIAVDSTTVEKRYGPKLSDIRPVYDAIRKRLVDGYEIVSACVVGYKGTVPIGLVPHRKAPIAAERAASKRRRRKAQEGELPNKLDLALALVSTAVGAGVVAPTVVGDSAFAVMWWLREIMALGRHWLVATRQDRRLRIGATIRAFRIWAKDVPLTLIETGDKGTSLHGTLLSEAILLNRHSQRKGLDCRPAYFERRNKGGRVIHRWYLVTSQLDWSLQEIWLHWAWRWKVEQLHRDSKQFMLLDAFHGRNWEGIVAHIACVSLRASLLYFMQAADPVCGAFSIDGLVPALNRAACRTQVQGAGIMGKVEIPPTLPATVLWQERQPPLPARYWPMALQAA